MGRSAKRFQRNQRRGYMRVLRLDGSDESKRAFLHMHAAMHATECRGIEQLRRVGKIIDKLEAIGALVEEGWQLATEGGALWLEAAEHAEVQARMGATPWLPAHARFVARTFELLNEAKEEDPGKPKMAVSA